MIKNYLKSFYHFIFFASQFFFFLLGLYLFIFFSLLIYALLVFLFRQKKIFYRDNSQANDGVVFTPVNGKVLSVKSIDHHPLFGDKIHCIEILIRPWDEYGVYFPISGELKDFYVKGKSMFDISSEPLAQESEEIGKGIAFTVENKEEEEFSLYFPKSILGIFPKIKVMPGDRGKIKANAGHFPFGGKVLLYLPEKYEILVARSDKLVAGDTVIAGRPE